MKIGSKAIEARKQLKRPEVIGSGRKWSQTANETMNLASRGVTN